MCVEWLGDRVGNIRKIKLARPSKESRESAPKGEFLRDFYCDQMFLNRLLLCLECRFILKFIDLVDVLVEVTFLVCEAIKVLGEMLDMTVGLRACDDIAVFVLHMFVVHFENV